MNRLQKHNLYHIKRYFERNTGTKLITIGIKEKNIFNNKKVNTKRLPKFALISVIFALFITLTAFAVTKFSKLNGDSLTMTASYYGNGVVWVEISNQSDKVLEFEPTMKLYYYSTQQLVKTTHEEPYIENLTIPANSTQTVRLDLRRTYDIETLENTKNDFYYLQMTNDSFLLGQKWSCMVSFTVSDYVTPWYELTDKRHLEGVLPSLQTYYYNFTPDIFARWTDVFDYVEQVQLELSKVDGNVVRACDSPIHVDYYDWLGSNHWSTFDGYYKLLGIDDTEYYDMIGVDLPCVQDNGKYSGGGWVLPLFYLYQYNKADISSPKDYVFMHGNLLTFEEIEPYKVYDDGEYVIYEMHHLVYTDLETYVKDMLLQRDDVYINDQIWTRIINFYNYWSNPQNMQKSFYNAYDPGIHQKDDLLTIEEVIEISRKGESISFEDIRSYRGSPSGLSIYESDTGMNCTIDGNYELFYALHLDGTLRGWYLTHIPSGESIDIRYEDVESFVNAHDEPMPRCACENTDEGYHGWMITMQWLLDQGNNISMSTLNNNCQYHFEFGETENSGYIIPIYDTDEFHLEFYWWEEENKWTLWLVHSASEDRIDLETEDSSAFVKSHIEYGNRK